MKNNVANLATGNSAVYEGTPREAILKAYAHSVGDPDVEGYEQKYASLIVEGKITLGCGDFAVLKNPGKEE